MENVIRTTYVNIWSAKGLLGDSTRMHSSVEYETAQEACIGREVSPDASFSLLGTLDLRPGHGQPCFVSHLTLMKRVHAEQLSATGG